MGFEQDNEVAAVCGDAAEVNPVGGIDLRAAHGEGVPVYVALGALRLDERNVRTDEPTEAEIEQLADLIDAQGLLQNLAVLAYPEPVTGRGKDKKRSFTHGVIAGGRSVSGALNPRKSGVGKQSVAVIRGSQLTALNFL